MRTLETIWLSIEDVIMVRNRYRVTVGISFLAEFKQLGINFGTEKILCHLGKFYYATVFVIQHSARFGNYWHLIPTRV